MNNPIFLSTPILNRPILIAAFRGWADAQDAASGALRYIIRVLSATKFAELDPEEFFVFTRVRPLVRTDIKGSRTIRWPSNNFYYIQGTDGQRDLILFVGVEPNLKWKTYSEAILNIGTQFNADSIITLGSLVDRVPHTRDPLITGSSNTREIQDVLEHSGIWSSGYQGPTGIGSVLVEMCNKLNLNSSSLWGHSPHYLQASPNPKISLALLKTLELICDIKLPLEELSDACIAFETQVDKAIGNNEELLSYVTRLEERYDRTEEKEGSQELPAPDILIKDLEDFLIQQQRDRDETLGDTPKNV